MSSGSQLESPRVGFPKNSPNLKLYFGVVYLAKKSADTSVILKSNRLKDIALRFLSYFIIFVWPFFSVFEEISM